MWDLPGPGLKPVSPALAGRFLTTTPGKSLMFDLDAKSLWAQNATEGDGGRIDWEFGVNRCKLLYIGWINKVLLYSTGNYIQYPEINHNGKEYEKECIYMYN